MGESSTLRFASKNLKIVETSENEQTKFQGWVAKNKGFSLSEKEALKVDDLKAFNDYWQRTEDAEQSFESRHEKGCGLWARQYQHTASLVLPFMNDFSPIVQIVTDFGAPYGGLAVGTISLLFAVAGNKHETETSLNSTISSIRDRLPGLRLYQQIYNEKHELDVALQSQIVSAYRCFMEFCMDAIKYYKASGRRRWLKAFLPANSFAHKAEEVQAHIVQIRRLCEELLSKNVDTIKRSNEVLQQDNKDLKAQISELQKGHDHDRLNEIQRLLQLGDFSEESHRKTWERHAQAVDRDEDLNTGYLQQMRGPELDALRARSDYQNWHNSEHSSLLVLSSYNDASINRAHQCWLSPVAAAAVDTFEHQQPRPFYAYYAMTQNGKLLHDVISVILLQLLRQKSIVLRDQQRYAELRTELGDFQDSGVDGNRKMTAMEKVALRVVDFFDESETAYIILDRADRCRDPKTADHRKALLKLLVKMVEAARCKLRILTVINGHSWPVEKYHDELGAKMKERFIICTVKQLMIDH